MSVKDTCIRKILLRYMRRILYEENQGNSY